MPLPADFPLPPQRPPSAVAFLSADGTVAKAWLNYFDALARYEERVRAYLDTL